MLPTHRVLATALAISLGSLACSPADERGAQPPVQTEQADTFEGTSPTVSLVLPKRARAGEPAAAKIAVEHADGRLEDIAIDWGDGKAEPSSFDLDITCEVGADPQPRKERRRRSHVYAKAGTYTVEVTAYTSGCFAEGSVVKEAVSIRVVP